MFRRFTKKRVAVALTALTVCAVAAAAFASYTGTGSGSGTAAVGTSTPFQISSSSASTLYPGQSSTVTFTVANSGHGNQQLGTISLSGIKACTGGTNNDSVWDATNNVCTDATNGGHEVMTCEDYSNSASSTTKDFSMANVAENQDLNAQTTYYGDGNTTTHPNQLTTGSGTLTMNDLSTLQDQCKNANLYLSFSS